MINYIISQHNIPKVVVLSATSTFLVSSVRLTLLLFVLNVAHEQKMKPNLQQSYFSRIWTSLTALIYQTRMTALEAVVRVQSTPVQEALQPRGKKCTTYSGEFKG